MGSRLRDYIKVYDDALDQPSIDKLIGYFDKVGDRELLIDVRIPNYASYLFTPITANAVGGDADAMEMHKFLSRMMVHYFNIYQDNLGISEEQRFRPDYDEDNARAYTESFFMRKYEAGVDFQRERFDARCTTTGRRFVSFILTLTEDSPGLGSIQFDPGVGIQTLSYKPGRLIIYPSNWMYPYKEEISSEPRYEIYGFYAWAAPGEVK